MTLEEAIGILERNCPNRVINFVMHDATRLGIEALKYIKEWRIPPHGGATILLPGETKESE